MTLLRTVARPMLASIFVLGGAYSLKNPKSAAPKVQPLADAISKTSPQPGISATNLVRLNGVIHVTAGLGLASGTLPRLSALTLAATMPATTVIAHQYWNETDPVTRRNQLVHFTKNVAIAGGLLLSTLDPEPNKRWIGARAKNRVVEASHTIADQVDGLRN